MADAPLLAGQDLVRLLLESELQTVEPGVTPVRAFPIGSTTQRVEVEPARLGEVAHRIDR